MASPEFKLAILASGSGSTSEPMLAIPGLVSAVLSNRSEAGILDRAKRHRIHSLYLLRKQHLVFNNRNQPDPVASDLHYQDAILQSLRQLGITHVAQQGWMVRTGPQIINHFRGRITNSHPGPLDPGFIDLGGIGMHGLAVHQAAISLRRQLGHRFVTGPSLHLVDIEYDRGELLAFEPVDILPTDSPETLSARLKSIEAQQSLNFWLAVRRTGRIEPIQRQSRLFKPSEYPIVEQAKADAIRYYQH